MTAEAKLSTLLRMEDSTPKKFEFRTPFKIAVLGSGVTLRPSLLLWLDSGPRDWKMEDSKTPVGRPSSVR